MRRVFRAIWEHIRLGPMTSGARNGLLYLLIVAVLIDLGEFYLLARSINTLGSQQHAQCLFYNDLGGAPLTSRTSQQPSKFGVEIVSDARVAWRQLGCTGVQQPPDPTFVQWATHYNLPTG